MDIKSRESAETLLLNALQSHNIQVRPEDVKRALNDNEQGKSFIDWTLTYLSADNLLTVDELELYGTLDRNGQVDKLVEQYDLSEVQALREEDIRSAVEELKRSTEAINKQTETLRHQKEALSRLAAKSSEAQSRRQKLDLTRQHKLEAEKAQVSTEITEISHEIASHLSRLRKNVGRPPSALRESLDTVLRSDDKLLASLQKLGWELDEPASEKAQPVEKLKETCMKLIKITVETVRTKLDTLYLNTLTAAESSGNTGSVSTEEVQLLQEEVESLYAEILPVAQMAVEQQHMEPALHAVSSTSGQSLKKTRMSLDYINECLDYLLTRIDCFKSRLRNLQSYETAMEFVFASAQSQLTSEADSKEQASSVNPNESPIRPTTRARGIGYSRDENSRRRSSGIQEQPALDVMMQSLGLPIEVYEATNTREKIRLLSQILHDRLRKEREMNRNTQDSFESALIAQIDDGRRAIQSLKDSFVAESSFGNVALVDPEIEESIQILGHEVEKARQKLAEVDTQVNLGHSEKREEILERWSR